MFDGGKGAPGEGPCNVGGEMFRYVGLYCRNQDCKAFIIWKKLKPGERGVTVRLLDTVSGKCPKCQHAFFVATVEMVEIETQMKASNDKRAAPLE